MQLQESHAYLMQPLFLHEGCFSSYGETKAGMSLISLCVAVLETSLPRSFGPEALEDHLILGVLRTEESENLSSHSSLASPLM